MASVRSLPDHPTRLIKFDITPRLTTYTMLMFLILRRSCALNKTKNLLSLYVRTV